MKQGFNNILFQHYLNDIHLAHKKYFPKGRITKEGHRRIKRNFFKLLSEVKSYRKIEVNQGDVSKLIIAKPEEIFTERHIGCKIFTFSKNTTKEELLHEIKQVKSSFKEKLKLFVSIMSFDSHLIRRLKECGHEPWSYNLVGDVDQSLKTLKSVSLPNPFSLSTPMLKELSELLKQDRKASENEPSCCLGAWNREKEREMKIHYKKCLKEKHVVTIKSDQKIVAAIAYSTRGKVGHICSIFVVPEFQGKNLSKVLYKEALLRMKEKKVHTYTGHTSTLKVLAFAKKLKRTIFMHNYKI